MVGHGIFDPSGPLFRKPVYRPEPASASRSLSCQFPATPFYRPQADVAAPHRPSSAWHLSGDYVSLWIASGQQTGLFSPPSESFHLIDHDELQRNCCSLQFQPELLLKRR